MISKQMLQGLQVFSKFGKFSFSPNLENACKNNIPGTKKCLPTRCL